MLHSARKALLLSKPQHEQSVSGNASSSDICEPSTDSSEGAAPGGVNDGNDLHVVAGELCPADALTSGEVATGQEPTNNTSAPAVTPAPAVTSAPAVTPAPAVISAPAVTEPVASGQGPSPKRDREDKQENSMPNSNVS